MYVCIYVIVKTMCPPCYHHNGFVATHALGHMYCTSCAQVMYCTSCASVRFDYSACSGLPLKSIYSQYMKSICKLDRYNFCTIC